MFGLTYSNLCWHVLNSILQHSVALNFSMTIYNKRNKKKTPLAFFAVFLFRKPFSKFWLLIFPFFSDWLIFIMQQLLYLYKICNRFLFRSSSNCISICGRNMHSSLASEYGAEEDKSSHLYINKKLPCRVGNEDNQCLHIPVMVEEVVKFLAPQEGQVSSISYENIYTFLTSHYLVSWQYYL